ncbi:hypothetical protein CTEN210_17791 [Chaetoceros tenuissimus]|uniref:EF-hand domain-containing protein n=1 Tax=Chaetoceros tenuissimus TaxID=426638 RepID=A0AAD3DE50_9STRA|nr:hypothetical protein CTEN210_17740 [Chaetoceros tenuissimus]GFH61315.1 hypothetical protein CTEN210_17791 [Chaetoceros tenuissimus]
MVCCQDRSFQKYKIERYFDFLDFDNNQSVNVEDLVLWADKAAVLMKEDGISVSEEQKKQLLQRIRRVFNAMTAYGFAGKNKQRFANYLITTSKLPFFKTFFKLFCKPVFEAFDFDGNGELSWKEFYYIMMKPIGLSEEDAKIAFNIVDEDKNGVLSIEEFTIAAIGYFSDTKVTKYAFAYGKIDSDDVPEKFKESIDTTIKSIADSFNDDQA